MSPTYWHIHNCSLFNRLSVDQLAIIERHALIRKIPKAAAIYLPQDRADSALLVADGRIQICSTTPEGKQSILGYVEPGELFGELSVIDRGMREERAEACMKSTVIAIPADILRDLMEQSSALSVGVTKLIGLRRRRIERRLKSLLFRSNYDRLTHLLIELTEQYGTATSEGIELGIRLSHQDLASIIGATRETVTMLLGDMQSAGILRIQRQKLIIFDLRRLHQNETLGAPPAPVDRSATGLERSAGEQARAPEQAVAKIERNAKPC